MARKRFTPEQIVTMLREAGVLLNQSKPGVFEAVRVDGLCRVNGCRDAPMDTAGGRMHDSPGLESSSYFFGPPLVLV